VEDLSKRNKNRSLLGLFFTSRLVKIILNKNQNSSFFKVKCIKKLNDLCSESAMHSKQLAGSGLYTIEAHKHIPVLRPFHTSE
jgi:hypothetical protein